MAVVHSNPGVTKAWSKLVDAADSFLMSAPAVTGGSGYINADPDTKTHPAVELAPMEADEAPDADMRGHPLSAMLHEAGSRSVFGSGHIYIRLAPNQIIESATVVLSVW